MANELVITDEFRYVAADLLEALVDVGVVKSSQNNKTMVELIARRIAEFLHKNRATLPQQSR